MKAMADVFCLRFWILAGLVVFGLPAGGRAQEGADSGRILGVDVRCLLGRWGDVECDVWKASVSRQGVLFRLHGPSVGGWGYLRVGVFEDDETADRRFGELAGMRPHGEPANNCSCPVDMDAGGREWLEREGLSGIGDRFAAWEFGTSKPFSLRFRRGNAVVELTGISQEFLRERAREIDGMLQSGEGCVRWGDAVEDEGEDVRRKRREALAEYWRRTHPRQRARLQEEWSATRAEMLRRQSLCEQLEKLSGDALLEASAYLAPDATRLALRQQLLEAKVLLQNSLDSGVYGENHPEVKRLKAEVAELERLRDTLLDGLKAELRAEFELAKAKFEAVDEAKGRWIPQCLDAWEFPTSGGRMEPWDEATVLAWVAAGKPAATVAGYASLVDGPGEGEKELCVAGRDCVMAPPVAWNPAWEHPEAPEFGEDENPEQ